MGTISNTNKVTVLLGDDTFVEKTCKRAQELCQRRLNTITDKLNGSRQELSRIHENLKTAERLQGVAHVSADGFVDIHEPMDAEDTEEIHNSVESSRPTGMEMGMGMGMGGDGNGTTRDIIQPIVERSAEAHGDNETSRESRPMSKFARSRRNR